MKTFQKLATLFAIGLNLFTFTPALAQTLTPTELLNTSELTPALGLSTTDIRTTIARIVRSAMAFLGIVTVLLMLYAGFLWMTAGGNDEQVGTAKKIMVAAVIGLAIILSAYGLANFVINQLVQATA